MTAIPIQLTPFTREGPQLLQTSNSYIIGLPTAHAAIQSSPLFFNALTTLSILFELTVIHLTGSPSFRHLSPCCKETTCYADMHVFHVWVGTAFASLSFHVVIFLIKRTCFRAWISWLIWFESIGIRSIKGHPTDGTECLFHGQQMGHWIELTRLSATCCLLFMKGINACCFPKGTTDMSTRSTIVSVR